MRRQRVLALSAVLLVSVVALAGLAVTAGDSAGTTEDEQHPGQTLVTVQAYGWFGNHNGDVFIVDREGERVWEYRPDDAAVFDAEMLESGNVMVSFGQKVPDADCPERWANTARDYCIRNRVQEVDPDTDEVVWEYTWYDRFMSYHEVHDADRLENGETVIIDMARHRTFTVDRNGTVTWEWSATEHLDEGSEFWAKHVEGTPREDHAYTGPEQDWTHMNDVDRLENGNFLMSIRNFDVTIEVDPETDEVVEVYGDPGNHDLMYEQHDPDYLEAHDTLIVADSENNRVVEYDAETMEEVWRYEGPGPSDRLQWPRDADRLPNGNTLVVDSRGFRVLEVDPEGEVVWSHEMSEAPAIVYDADRLGPDRRLEEEPENVPPGDDLNGTYHGGGLSGAVAVADSWLGFLLPQWVGVYGLLAVLVGLGALAGLTWEGYRHRRAA
jgi:outer membrane protein assembly factor BamB